MGTVKVVVGVEAAAALAERRLAQALPRRWRHVRAVAQRARSVATTLARVAGRHTRGKIVLQIGP